MEYDTNPATVRPATERLSEYFSVRLTMSGAAQEFENPRQAGKAFFGADPAERPSVVHIDGNTARTMARTEIHGAHETGEPKYFKSLPDSHAPDAAFRAGFLEAMETSLSERLSKVEWGKEGQNIVERLDAGLKDDLEAFARRDPEKAAALWAGRTDVAPLGPELVSAVQVREEVADSEVGEYFAAIAEKPPVIVTGDWVTTDQNVELRPVAVTRADGVHTGYEAKIPEGESEITVSDRTFPNSREALRHAYDFYEGGEDGLVAAVKRAVEVDRDLLEEPVRSPKGLTIEHREQPEFSRPETAIYAGEEAHLILTLGRANAHTHALAERLVADPEFRKVIAEHIPDAGTSIGTGRFMDGEDSGGFLPDELLVVTAYDRDGDGQVLAKFPDDGPLSEALARHLAESPVLTAYVTEEREQLELWQDPARAISAWMEQSSARIERLPWDTQDDLRAEMYGIAKEAVSAFGLDGQRDDIEAPPRSTLYSTSISATSLAIGAEEVDLQPGVGATLKAGIHAAATEAGIDGAKIERRLETGAANVHQEESWVKSDIVEVAGRHRLDLGDEKARSRAAELVDRFYEEAAELVHAARASELTREQNPLIEALGTMVKVRASQGTVAFRNEDQARDFAEEMKEHYGASILKDIAAGRTEALAEDVLDPAARQSMAQAVVAAAMEHPSLGLSAHEAETAARKLAAEAHGHENSPARARERSRDREF